MRSSNPVLTRLGDVVQRERSAAPVEYDYKPYNPYAPAQPVQPARPIQATRAMTVDDVVVRTVGLLMLTGITGALSWLLLPSGPVQVLAMIGSMIAGLVLGLVISFARVTNPVVIAGYAVLQGILLGVVSGWFERRFPGIVIQAVVGTFGVFAGMAALYKARVIRATPRFAKIVVGALFGVVLLMFLNLGMALFGHNLGLQVYDVDKAVGPVPIIFSAVVIVIAALTFILDFDMVEQGVRMGLPERFAWYCAFGLLVGLIFLYWEVLRMLSYLRR